MSLARWPSNAMASLLLLVMDHAMTPRRALASGLDGGAIKRYFSRGTTRVSGFISLVAFEQPGIPGRGVANPRSVRAQTDETRH